MIARVGSVFLLDSESEIDKRVEANKAAADTGIKLDNNENEIIIWTKLLSS